MQWMLIRMMELQPDVSNQIILIRMHICRPLHSVGDIAHIIGARRLHSVGDENGPNAIAYTF